MMPFAPMALIKSWHILGTLVARDGLKLSFQHVCIYVNLSRCFSQIVWLNFLSSEPHIWNVLSKLPDYVGRTGFHKP